MTQKFLYEIPIEPRTDEIAGPPQKNPRGFQQKPRFPYSMILTSLNKFDLSK